MAKIKAPKKLKAEPVKIQQSTTTLASCLFIVLAAVAGLSWLFYKLLSAGK